MSRRAKGFIKNLRSNIASVCMIFGLLAAFLVLTSWTYGYWSNGLYGTKFQIDSCWQGISACGVGLIGLFKWLIESVYNSPKGQSPTRVVSNEVINRYDNQSYTHKETEVTTPVSKR